LAWLLELHQWLDWRPERTQGFFPFIASWWALAAMRGKAPLVWTNLAAWTIWIFACTFEREDRMVTHSMPWVWKIIMLWMCLDSLIAVSNVKLGNKSITRLWNSLVRKGQQAQRKHTGSYLLPQ
jgi:hypothetical protein